MRIDLGQHLTYDGREINAYIEPNFPAYRAGSVRDHGYLCLEEMGALQAMPEGIRLKLEGTPDDAATLQAAVGQELMSLLWAERERYDERPYYYCADHAIFGRIYFEPYVIDSGEISIAVTTRSADGVDACLLLPAHNTMQHLRTLFEQHHVHALHQLPDSLLLGEAIRQGAERAHLVLRSHEDFKIHVDWDFERRLNAIMLGATGREPLRTAGDIARYEALSLFTVRPSRGSLNAATAEFKRWFDESGEPRLEPLTSEALALELQACGMGRAIARTHADQASLSSIDWDWLKEKRLGRMRVAVDLLHDLITHQAQCGEAHLDWIGAATIAADFCAPMPTSPSRIYAVIKSCPSRLTLPAQLSARLREVLAYMSDPANGLSVQSGQPTAKLLDALNRQNESSIARWKARCSAEDSGANTDSPLLAPYLLKATP